MTASAARAEQRLVPAGIVFAAASTMHAVDHLRRGQGSITDSLYWLGNLGLVLQVATISLVLTRHRVAPIAALATGSSLAVGFTAAHWLPEWGPISDPIWEVDTAVWFSIVAASSEILGAIVLAVTALAVVRHRGLESFAAT